MAGETGETGVTGDTEVSGSRRNLENPLRNETRGEEDRVPR